MTKFRRFSKTKVNFARAFSPIILFYLIGEVVYAALVGDQGLGCIMASFLKHIDNYVDICL